MAYQLFFIVFLNTRVRVFTTTTVYVCAQQVTRCTCQCNSIFSLLGYSGAVGVHLFLLGQGGGLGREGKSRVVPHSAEMTNRMTSHNITAHNITSTYTRQHFLNRKVNCSSQGDFLAFSGFSLLTTGSYTLCGCIMHVCIESKYLLPVSVCLFVCLFVCFFHERKRMVAACRISLMPRLYFAPHKIVVPYNWRGYCANRYKNCIPCHKSLIELDPQEMEVHNNML